MHTYGILDTRLSATFEAGDRTPRAVAWIGKVCNRMEIALGLRLHVGRRRNLLTSANVQACKSFGMGKRYFALQWIWSRRDTHLQFVANVS
jgi:hypothetical protein